MTADNSSNQHQPVGTLYANWQLAKALTTSQTHQDAVTRERAQEKAKRWEQVIHHAVQGQVQYGSRTPFSNVPAWVTLEVITGGFATGNWLAGGELQNHEQEFLQTLDFNALTKEIKTNQHVEHSRLALNTYFLTDKGLDFLQQHLQNQTYEICVPEEAALLTMAWLVQNNQVDQAQALIETIAPWFAHLRFYPQFKEQPQHQATLVRLENINEVVSELSSKKQNERILQQKEAVEVWAPFMDKMVALFLQTFENEQPAPSRMNTSWLAQACDLYQEYTRLRKQHTYSNKPNKTKLHFAKLLTCLENCIHALGAANKKIATSDLGRIKHIVSTHIQKHGLPDSTQNQNKRAQHQRDVSAPMHADINQIIVNKMKRLPQEHGMDEADLIKILHIDANESSATVPENTPIPLSIVRKVQRCLNNTLPALIENKLITSGEVLAAVLPQITSSIRAAGITDPKLAHLYAATYRAFRQRRSLLLLNLEHQVQIQELPWVACIESERNESLSDQILARQTLEEICIMTLTAFPQAILPNKLLQEFSALITTAKLETPLVEELATDIFMGTVTPKFTLSAHQAGTALQGTLYANYYQIDCDAVLEIIVPPKKQTETNMIKHVIQKLTSHKKSPHPTGKTIIQLCEERAGVKLERWKPAISGMILEQLQILTTHNLTQLIQDLNLRENLTPYLTPMTHTCFSFICQHQQNRLTHYHAALIMLKQTAYAWRQMVFYLSLQTQQQQHEFIQWAHTHLNQQTQELQTRFAPVLEGLQQTITSGKPPQPQAFLGWCSDKHWLMPHIYKESI